MKKILVMSDTHGNKAAMDAALKKFADVDAVIHLGDYVRDAEYVKTQTDKKVYAVRGNCDIASRIRSEITIRTGGKKILAVHGHKQNVKASLLRLGLYAREKEADAALFGHTHIPTEQIFEGVILYNPGSLGEPRGRRPSVGIITIDEGVLRIKTAHI
jgi:putative phosphoesterase